ncbi:MAG: DUF3887 domain-containing protein [candidate division Zixibacteria bacterium]|nr:DUF3887 domain-containing protein [candidate division Zixibacteria bacterium]
MSSPLNAQTDSGLPERKAELIVTLKSFVQQIVDDYNQNDSMRLYGRFSENLKAAIPLSAIGTEFRQSRSVYGPALRFGQIRSYTDISAAEPLQVQVPLVFEKGSRDLQLWINKEGQIEWLEFEGEKYSGFGVLTAPAENAFLLAPEKLDDLKEEFEGNSGSVQLIALLSPT